MDSDASISPDLAGRHEITADRARRVGTLTNVILLGGSPSKSSRSTRLLQHAGEMLALLGHHTVSLQVRDLPPQALLHADFGDTDLKEAKEQVARADAVVIATPIYKAAYSGLLKTFLDVLPPDGLAGKLVLPLATGGSQSHMLALDYALRPVLSALSARHVLPSIYATDAQIAWTAESVMLDPAIALRLLAGIENLSAGLYALQESAGAGFAPGHFSEVRCSA